LIPFEKVDAQCPYQILLVPLKEKKTDRWLTWLLDHVQRSPTKTLKNILHELFPERLAVGLIQQAECDPRSPVGELTKHDKQQFARMMGEGIPLDLIARRPGDEFVTA
jgi:predicted flavoprotein YhiN